MKTIESLHNEYLRTADEASDQLTQTKQRINRISTLRICLFVLGIGAGIYFRSANGYLLIAGGLIILTAFIGLMYIHNGLFHRKAYLQKKIEVNRSEANALQYDYSAFEDGSEFIDPSHLYTYDLDVFGPHSLFQAINRTGTLWGKRQLAVWLTQHLTQKSAIEQRQQAVKELAKRKELRHGFRIECLLNRWNPNDEDLLLTWGKDTSYFKTDKWLRTLPTFAMATNAGCLLLCLIGFMSWNHWMSIICAFVFVSFLFTKRILQQQAMSEKRYHNLSAYANLFRTIEEASFHSKLLINLQKNLGSEHCRASQAIRLLHKHLHALNQRNNMLMYMVLNGLFCWEIKQTLRIEQWKEQYAENVPLWLDSIGQIDALLSMGNFAATHPNYTYPTLLSQSNSPTFQYCAQSLGHPIMDRRKRVQNDICIPKRPYFLIITGANMAGKSTYLRTVSINYLLGCMGMPMCAKQATMYPAQLVTSLRTSDSLKENESYFFAELKRLKLIVNKLQRGEELFIVLDEILKGTNSVDKQKGSFALIKQFIQLNANGIIATHDLMLGTLHMKFPENINNYCFEANIKNEKLNFTYKLRPGVAQNMNACFLMKQMGIAEYD